MDDLDAGIFSIEHDVEGIFRASREPCGIRVTARWPFDLEADDFVEIEEVFTVASWASSFTDWQSGLDFDVSNALGAWLRIRDTPDGALVEIKSRDWALSRSIQFVTRRFSSQDLS